MSLQEDERLCRVQRDVSAEDLCTMFFTTRSLSMAVNPLLKTHAPSYLLAPKLTQAYRICSRLPISVLARGFSRSTLSTHDNLYYPVVNAESEIRMTSDLVTITMGLLSYQEGRFPIAGYITMDMPPRYWDSEFIHYQHCFAIQFETCQFPKQGFRLIPVS
jgi:hypothetical protein